MNPKHQSILSEYDDLTTKLASGDLDNDTIITLSRKQSKMMDSVELIRRLQKIESELLENADLLSGDVELAEIARQEMKSLEAEKLRVEEKLDELLIPKDERDERPCILEIRGGAGGDEASLFAAEILRAYGKFLEDKGFKMKVVSSSKSDAGGIKEVIAEVSGAPDEKSIGPFGYLKYESGVHRVQRVPETEKQGRVHTSTVTVAVMPEVEEKDFHIDPKDLKIEATTSSGHGGQSVNTTYSAIRILHIPTGITAQCQDERSQAQNKEKALAVIRARVASHYREIEDAKIRDTKRAQIGTGDRSEKIRTYNFPQDRVTDHRINQNFSQINVIMEGKLEPIISALQKAEIELLKQS